MALWDGNESSCSCDCEFHIPKGGTLDKLAVKDISGIANLIYPVGAIYMSVNSVDPSTLFGGEWERIQDRFLLAAGSSYAAGNTGGNASHQHIAPIGYNTSNKYLGVSFAQGDETTNVNSAYAYYPNAMTTDSGSANWRLAKTDLVSNMPPYLTVYVWQRIA